MLIARIGLLAAVAAAAWLVDPFRLRALLVDAVLGSIDYIMHQPFGIKQNTIIKTLLGSVFKQILSVDTGLDLSMLLCVCTRLIAAVYAYNMMVLMDIFDLIQNKTYNPSKKRIDTVYLDTDQIVLSVFLFSFGIIIYTNLVLYYIFFVFIAVCTEAARLLWSAVDALPGGGAISPQFEARGGSFSYIRLLRRIFTGEFLYQVYQ
ncbi:hypothetical protein PAPHI01_2178 [Pancytospora philotis]|nr:hypothetical protein PAPHI01_2178 [Pancytospora philotis]